MFRSSREGPTEEKAGRHTPIRLGTALIAAVGMLLGPLALAASAATAPHASATVEGSYVSLTPFRLLDTRTGSPIAAKASLNVQVTGVGTTPVPAGASAVVANVTAVSPTSNGFLTVFPEGATQPLVSNLNFTAGKNVANLVTVGLSSAGGITIYNSAGTTNVVVDVEGYYTSTLGTTGLYTPVTPYRALGSLAEGATVQANTSVPVTVTGVDGIPSTATAVVGNVTAAAGTNPSFLTVYPAGVTMPTASNLNFTADQVVANRVTVGVGTGGVIEIYNHTGTVSVDFDLDGYYSSTGAYFVPITPIRVADTRTASVVGTGTPINASASEAFQIATTASGIPSGAAAVATNVTVVAADAPGYLTVYPTSATTNPVASDVNWTANEIVPNFTVAPTDGTGSVEVYNSHGEQINLVIDAFGYFEDSTPTMVSAVVTATTIAITYNEAVSCPTSFAGFVYDWTGSASGITSIASCAVSTSGLVLTLTGVFTLPASTGGTLSWVVQSSPSTTNSVYAAGPVFELAQTIPVAAATVVPVIVSAYYADPVVSDSVVITYNEAVACTTGSTVAADFTYDYTGVASGFASGATQTATCSGDTVTLTSSAAISPPASDATIVYTEPAAATLSTADAVYAAGSVSPVLYAASQTVSGAEWVTPTITGATVTPGAYGTGAIAVTYSEPVVCPGTAADVQAIFEYTNSGVPAYPSNCSASGDMLTLTDFDTATTGTTGATLLLPGASDTLIYTVPASETTTNAVNSTVDSPAFPLAQTFALTATAAPTMTGATVNSTSIVITYNEEVTCPATFADTLSDFAYYSTGTTSGITTAPTTCATSTSSPFTLTLSGGAFVAPVGTTASIKYTAPATNSATASVYATNTALYAATQTLALTEVPAMVSAVVSASSIAITYNEPVFCSSTGTAYEQFKYYTAGATSGGTVTAGCSVSGDVLTLVSTSGFVAASTSASIVYTEPGTDSATASVYAGSAPVAYAANQTLPWSSISNV
jgi:hypothetical protein